MNETPEQYIAVTEVEPLLSEDDTVILIDARTAEEFAEGHVPGAVNVSIPDLAAYVRSRDNTVEGLLITMCGSTGRGEKAAAALASLGVKDIAVLDGGLKAWKEAGYPVSDYDTQEQCPGRNERAEDHGYQAGTKLIK